MGFSSFVWQLYVTSEEGCRALSRNVVEHASYFSHDPRTLPFEWEMLHVPLYNDDLMWTSAQTRTVDLRTLFKTTYSDCVLSSLEEAEELFTIIADEGLEWQKSYDDEKNMYALFYGGGSADAQSYDDIICSIQGLTAGLHEAFPEYFFPYLFARGFDRLQRIADQYDLSLPDIPGKYDKRGRALLYTAINREIQGFRKENGLSPQELNAFLYDFAEKEIGEPRVEAPLPPPSRIWFLMGGMHRNGDFEFLDGADGKSVTYWQGNMEARRGDIALMWCVSPRSAFHSVWRILTDGFVDPYFFYYTMIRIGHIVPIPEVTFSELLSHVLWGKTPAVRAHFQGCSGMPVSVEEYEAIKDIVRDKGGDVSFLPQSPEKHPLPNVELFCEHDVERHLVEPLLTRMGYSPEEWLYQHPVRMGRGQRNVPDYILGMAGDQGEESAVVIIECKLHVANTKARKETYIQGRSYALRLGCVVLAVAAGEGLWLYKRFGREFDESRYLFFTWKELEHPDVFARVNHVMGNIAVEGELRLRRRGKKREQ